MRWYVSLCSWLLNGYAVGVVLGLINMCLFRYMDMVGLGEYGYLMGEYLVIDVCGVVFGLLILLICLVLMMVGVRDLYMYLSIFAALLCCVTTHVFVFWFFYELSILCALVLLVKDSPYPERYVAGWYFAGYVVLGSIPLLVGIVLLSLFNGSSCFFSWCDDDNVSCLVWLLCIVFLSKVPVPPFHVWLPLVHAEASSPTSIILSGYIMKLGVLGVMRFCGSVLGSEYMMQLLVLVCFFGVLFVGGSYYECDAKRWLAMLSLYHILVSVVLCVYGEVGYEVVSLYYCLGHGLAAMAMFMTVWWGYSFVGSRDWGLLSSVLGGVLGMQVLVGGVFFCVAGFPPTTQFVSELLSLVCVGDVDDMILFVLMGIFIFGGSLVVFIIYGGVIGSMGVVGECWRSGHDRYLLCVLVVSIFSLLLVFLV